MKKYLFLLSLLGVLILASPTWAQNTTSGAIVGAVTDPTGAAIPGAVVTATNTATGYTATVKASANGSYTIPLLKPGAYKLSITAPGFDTTTATITVAQGTSSNGDEKLTVGKSTTTVEVGANEVPLLQTEDAQLSTTFTQEQVQALPNPGGDITFYAQTAPGVVMNTGGGYGNFSVMGLPGTSNNFTVNGEQENDPFLNLNNSGPTNLLLGQNDIASVSVITTAYGAEFGSFGGAQVNEISRSGTNHFHGDANYWWNGRTLNANDWFAKENDVFEGQPNNTPFSNDNQWAASIGGPIIKDKTFFFVDWEGIRFITAPADQNFIPSPSYVSRIIGTDGKCDNASSQIYTAGNGNECPIYQQIFSLYANAPGASHATVFSGDPSGYTLTFNSSPKIFAKESLVTARVDQILSAKDQIFAHFKYDNGTQPTNVDPISTAFNDVSYQPEYEGQLIETHTFSPNVVNQFLFTAAHYGAYFQSVNQAAATAALPFTGAWEDEDFNTIGGAGYAFPQGRNATQYQFADDLSWTKKAHTLKFGYAWKKDDITNFDTGIYTNPLNFLFGDALNDGLPANYGFDYGYTYEYRQQFPTHLSNPNGLYSEGFYAQDTWKVSPTLLTTFGIRFEHNSNPVCEHACFSRLNSSFESFLTNTTTNSVAAPYNSSLTAGLTQAFPKFEAVSYEPRIEVIDSLTSKLVVRGGFGMFSDVFPGQTADNLLRNAPQDTRFQVYNAPVDPYVAGSAASIAAASNTAFQSGTSNFYNGGSYNTIHAIAPGFIRPNISTTENSIHYPTYEEYSLQVQYAVHPTTTVQVAYAGNHGYHEPVVAENANSYSASGFGGLPTSRPATNYGAVTNLSSTASSNYSGLMFSVIHRSKILQAQLNYTYSHTMDQVSNGGFLGFTSSSIEGPLAPNSLVYNYGNADYDIRNSLNGNYLLNIPSYGSGLIKEATGGWQLAGTVFYRAGFPFTVVSSDAAGSITNFTGGAVPAQLLSPVNHHCGNEVVALKGGNPVGCLGYSSAYYNNNISASPNFQDPTKFIPNQRNAYTGPHYFNTDMSLNKAFTLPWENVKMTAGVTAYNVLNHPNFANPGSDIDEGTFGQSFSEVGVPTSIYGSGLGGDAAIRIIQLHAKVSF